MLANMLAIATYGKAIICQNYETSYSLPPVVASKKQMLLQGLFGMTDHPVLQLIPCQICDNFYFKYDFQENKKCFEEKKNISEIFL